MATYLSGGDPRLLREPRHGSGVGLGAVGELGERVEDAGKVGVVVEMGGLQEQGLFMFLKVNTLLKIQQMQEQGLFRHWPD